MSTNRNDLDNKIINLSDAQKKTLDNLGFALGRFVDNNIPDQAFLNRYTGPSGTLQEISNILNQIDENDIPKNSDIEKEDFNNLKAYISELATIKTLDEYKNVNKKYKLEEIDITLQEFSKYIKTNGLTNLAREKSTQPQSTATISPATPQTETKTTMEAKTQVKVDPFTPEELRAMRFADMKDPHLRSGLEKLSKRLANNPGYLGGRFSEHIVDISETGKLKAVSKLITKEEIDKVIAEFDKPTKTHATTNAKTILSELASFVARSQNAQNKPEGMQQLSKVDFNTTNVPPKLATAAPPRPNTPAPQLQANNEEKNKNSVLGKIKHKISKFKMHTTFFEKENIFSKTINKIKQLRETDTESKKPKQ